MRKELVDWLQDLKAQHKSEPCFVAVEWGKHAHGTVTDARDELKDLAKQQWPGISDNLVTVMADAIGYEGDTHRAIWPDLEPIWLDDDREVTAMTQYNLDHYASGRLDIYKQRLDGNDPVQDPGGAIQRLSDLAHVGQQKWVDNARDKSWAHQLTEAIAKNPECEWAVAITGAEHFGKHTGNARDLIDKSATCKDLPSPGRMVRRVITL